MKKRFLSLAMLVATALPALCQDYEPDRVDDPVFMEYFDEAYSVYLDGSNRCAGISGLTETEAETVWTAATWGPVDYDLSFDNSVMTVKKTTQKNEKNWASVDLLLTDWKGNSGYKFPHLAEDAGYNVDTLTGMFVDMSLDGIVKMYLEVKTDSDCELRIDISDANGRQANGRAPANYRNSFRQEIYAEEGWTSLEIYWVAPLFDYYSQDYWGETNGMVKNFDSLWAYDENGEIVTYAVEAETPVPVSMQAICKISMIIDDGWVSDPGSVGDVKNVEFKNMVLGDKTYAVPFKAVTDENIDLGAIKYEPSNASLVRARQDIAWGKSIFLKEDNNPPYVKKEFQDIDIQEGQSSNQYYLKDYFADDESGLSFDAEIIGGSATSSVRVSGNYLIVYAGTGDPSPFSVSVTAIDTASNKTSQTFNVTVIENKKPYLIKPLESLELDNGFESYTLSFKDYFADEESYLTYTAEIDNLTPDILDVATYSDAIVFKRLDSINFASAEISITATDTEGASITESFTLNSEAISYLPPYKRKSISKIMLEEDFDTYTLDLNEYFAIDIGKIYYQFDVYGDDSFDTKLINGSKLVFTEDPSSDGIIQVGVTAKVVGEDFEGLSQYFIVKYEDGLPNRPTYVIDSFTVVDLTEGFGTDRSIDLNKIFGDPDGNWLSFSIDGYMWNLKGHKSASASIKNDTLVISEITNGFTSIDIKATDGEFSCVATVEVNVLEPSNDKIQTNNLFEYLTVPMTGTTEEIDLSDYFFDSDELTFSHYSYKGKFSISENKLTYDASKTGLSLADVLAVDNRGSEVGIYFYITVSDQIAVTENPENGTTVETSQTQENNETPLTTEGEETAVIDQSQNISLSEQTSVTGIQVYPTQFTETLTVENAEGLPVTVCNISGTELFKTAIKGNSEVINLGQLAPGMYFLQVNGKTVSIIKE